MSSARYGSALRGAEQSQDLASIEDSMLYDAEEIGESYLEGHPEEADQDYLANAIQRRCDQRKAKKRCGLDSQIRMDFASDRTVCVDGWILSRTEARLCALALLS